ncbi:MAG: hypothetical protein ACI9MR_003120 [Myxococcota bacterium]|jgi:hypothetical protein
MPAKIIILTVGALVALGCSNASEEQAKTDLEAAARLIDNAEPLLAEIGKKRTAGLSTAIKAVPLRGSTTPCKVDFEILRNMLSQDGSQVEKLVEFLAAEDVREKLGQRSAESAKWSIAYERRALKQNRRGREGTAQWKLAAAKRLGDPAGRRPDITIVVDDLAAGLVTEESRGTQFEGGILSGRMFVWDYEKAAVVCVAALRGRSSSKVNTRVGLPEDLRRNALENGLANLVAVGDRSVNLSAVGGDGAGLESKSTDVLDAAKNAAEAACNCKSAKCADSFLKQFAALASLAKTTAGQQRAVAAAYKQAERCALNFSARVIDAATVQGAACACANADCANEVIVQLPDPKGTFAGSAGEVTVQKELFFLAARCLMKRGADPVKLKWVHWVTVNRTAVLTTVDP